MSDVRDNGGARLSREERCRGTANTLARFVTDRYNLVRRGSRDAPGCTRGTIVSQVTVSSFMHGRNHYWRLCIRVNGIPASDPFSPLYSFFFSFTRAVSNVAAARKIPSNFLTTLATKPPANSFHWIHYSKGVTNYIQNRKNYFHSNINSSKLRSQIKFLKPFEFYS